MDLVDATKAVRMISARKAVVERLWVAPEIRYISREFVQGGAAGEYLPVFIVVTEQQPGVRTLSIENEPGSGKVGIEKRTISLPYLINVFVIRTHANGEYEVDTTWTLSFFRTSPLTGFSDKLLLCNLPNVNINPWNPMNPEATVGWTCLNNVS